MSWMIAELVGNVSSSEVSPTNDHKPEDTFPRTRYDDPKLFIIWKDMENQRGARFPCIHNKDVADLDFHSSDILPWKNHVAVPSC